MKEKPIIFTAESVNAIRGRRKTQTRRVISPLPEFISDSWYWRGGSALKKAGYGADYVHSDWDSVERAMLKIAPYQVGDRLWVKEAWRPYWESETAYAALQYKAGGESVTATDYQIESVMNGTDNWRSPRFMPRWASRITLEVTAVRVERLQDISEEDAKAEGVVPEDWERFEHPDNPWLSASAYRAEFTRRWDEINGKRAPWQSNAWVWVIEFKPLEVQ